MTRDIQCPPKRPRAPRSVPNSDPERSRPRLDDQKRSCDAHQSVPARRRASQSATQSDPDRDRMTKKGHPMPTKASQSVPERPKQRPRTTQTPIGLPKMAILIPTARPRASRVNGGADALRPSDSHIKFDVRMGGLGP